MAYPFLVINIARRANYESSAKGGVSGVKSEE